MPIKGFAWFLLSRFGACLDSQVLRSALYLLLSQTVGSSPLPSFSLLSFQLQSSSSPVMDAIVTVRMAGNNNNNNNDDEVSLSRLCVSADGM